MSGIQQRLLNTVLGLVCLLFTHCHNSVPTVPILLYSGTGTSPNDVKAIENILQQNNFVYARVNTPELNNLDTNQLHQYKLLIVPGGNFIIMGDALSAEATRNVQRAVWKGMNYLGICAGGFLAGNTTHNSFNFTGRSFKFYSAANKGIRKTAVPVTDADGIVTEQYWEDGPAFDNWGEIISRYPDSTAATVQGNYGGGWIVLTGIHAEAPANWRTQFHFTTSLDASHRYASKLISAALLQKRLPHF